MPNKHNLVVYRTTINNFKLSSARFIEGGNEETFDDFAPIGH